MKIFNKDLKMPKDAIWLVPGLRVKRWFALTVVGSVLAAIGMAFLFRLAPIEFIKETAKQIFHIIPPEFAGIIFIALGVAIFLHALKSAGTSMFAADGTREKQAMGEALYRRMKLSNGPKIVAIGGGTGLSTMLRGIKKLTNNITAIVTVGDDGGSSGRLREEMGVLPPGDIRNCIAALADDDDIVTKLFQYRFKTGEGLLGHSFGNLFLTAMSAVCGDMVTAIKESSKVLLIKGRVLPATTADVRLVAKMEDGSIIKGESQIPEAHKRIVELSCEPLNCEPTPEVIEAINDADLIILGPGSLYTSVIPNLLVKKITLAIEKSKAKKIYACNIMTQPGETDNYSVSDHVKAIFNHAKAAGVKSAKFFDAVLINDYLPDNLAKKYEEQDSLPVEVDFNEVKNMGVEIVTSKLFDYNEDGYVRHSPTRLAKAIYYWFKKGSKKNPKTQEAECFCTCEEAGLIDEENCTENSKV